MLAGVDWSSVGVAAGAIAGVLAALIAGASYRLNRRADRRKNQPVVVCHQVQKLMPWKHGNDWMALAFLENGGQGPAFNVRFGIEIRGRRFFYTNPAGAREPARLRLMQAGATEPHLESGKTYPRPAEPIVVDTPSMFGLVDGSGHGIAEDVIYWCWFENSYGHTYETRNPVDPTKDLTIRRIRFATWREGRAIAAREALREDSGG